MINFLVLGPSGLPTLAALQLAAPLLVAPAGVAPEVLRLWADIVAEVTGDSEPQLLGRPADEADGGRWELPRLPPCLPPRLQSALGYAWSCHFRPFVGDVNFLLEPPRRCCGEHAAGSPPLHECPDRQTTLEGVVSYLTANAMWRSMSFILSACIAAEAACHGGGGGGGGGAEAAAAAREAPPFDAGSGARMGGAPTWAAHHLDSVIEGSPGGARRARAATLRRAVAAGAARARMRQSRAGARSAARRLAFHPSFRLTPAQPSAALHPHTTQARRSPRPSLLRRCRSRCRRPPTSPAPRARCSAPRRSRLPARGRLACRATATPPAPRRAGARAWRWPPWR